MAKANLFSTEANSVMAGVIGYDLISIIDTGFKESTTSPIDNFIYNVTEINRLFTANPSQVLGNLIILGYVSAIESYFRAVFRRLILIDDASRVICEKKQVSYGAALYNDSLMLPEALFEDISFAGKRNITTSINNFLGLNIQDSTLPSDLSTNLEQFDGICELRHCIVHRFGKFGSRNAITLGLSKHSKQIEKPINCDFNTLQQIITVCQNTVRITNNFLFEKIMNRLIINGNSKNLNTIWTWDYSKDKNLFLKYYKTFYSTLSPPTAATTPKKMYDKYMDHYKNI